MNTYQYEILDQFGDVKSSGTIALPVQPLKGQIVLVGDDRMEVFQVVIATTGVKLELQPD